MAGGSWKVAYADFMTAMMAFFLLMWLLNATTEETRQGLAGYFALTNTKSISQPYNQNIIANNPILQFIDTLDQREFKMDEIEQSKYEIANKLNEYVMQDPKMSQETGITSDGLGVILTSSSGLLFAPESIQLTLEGQKLLDRVASIMSMYQVFLVVRGHSSPGESMAPYANGWALSSARANAAVRYLISRNVNPNFIRSVSYGDTRPAVDAEDPDALRKNSRVEFTFHRQEVMQSVVGY